MNKQESTYFTVEWPMVACLPYGVEPQIVRHSVAAELVVNVDEGAGGVEADVSGQRRSGAHRLRPETLCLHKRQSEQPPARTTATGSRLAHRLLLLDSDLMSKVVQHFRSVRVVRPGAVHHLRRAVGHDSWKDGGLISKSQARAGAMQFKP